MQIEKTCAQCGKVFAARGWGSTRRRFCSRECTAIWWKAETARRRRKSPVLGEGETKSCAICGKPFVPPQRQPFAKYCSPECAGKAQEQREQALAERGKEARKQEKAALGCTCMFCGKVFIPTHKRNPNRRTYCSPECRTKHAVRLKTEQYQPKPRVEPRVCEACGKWFSPPPQVPRAVTCSPKCSAARVRTRKKAERQAEMAERQKMKRPVSADMRKTKRRQTYCNGNWLPAMERADYRCELCGKSDREQLMVHHRDGSGEYVKISSPGGQPNHAPENLVVLCENCHWQIHRVSVVWVEGKPQVKGPIFAKLGLSGTVSIAPS